MNSIFISYARDDAAEVAEYLHNRLAGCGYSVWKDDHDLPLGKHFPKELSENIVEKDHFIILLSKAALSSHWVDEEINTAKAAAKHIIPILIEKLDLPPHLLSLNYLDMTNKNEYWKALHKLANNLEGGKDIPRVYNMSRHTDIEVNGVLVLANIDFEPVVNLENSDSVLEIAKRIAVRAIPCLRQTRAGIIPNGFSPLALSILAYLSGVLNQMPNIYLAQRNQNDRFGISRNNYLSLQDIREIGLHADNENINRKEKQWKH